MPASLRKDATTMKKISMMNTTSSIGVKSICASSASPSLFLFRINQALLVIRRQVIPQERTFPRCNPGDISISENP